MRVTSFSSDPQRRTNRNYKKDEQSSKKRNNKMVAQELQ